jgi:dGTPase
LNEDLAEAIALAHDLGHSPFGHSGEEMLAECMREHGGFEHNRQSLRVVELLENPYPKFPGLNLTLEVREGLDKTQVSSLEAQIADLADEITYYSHDLDDAIDFDVLNFAQLEEVDVWKVAADSVRARYADLREPDLHKLIIRDVIDRQVQDVIMTSAEQINSAKVQSRDDVRNQPALIRYGDELAKANRELRKFLYQNVYYHPRVAEVNKRACEMLRKVFESYLLDPSRLGDAAARRIESEGLHRTVCDYIAGMTDRYLMEEFERMTEE